MVRAVIFDLDDTLISELEYIKSGYHHVARLLNNNFGLHREKIFTELVELFNDNPKNVFDRILKKYNIEPSVETIDHLVSEYRGHFPTIYYYDDVLPCLSKLKIERIKTGIITDGFANAQRQKLKAVNAERHFDEIIITDELGSAYWKPHPKAFELMKDKLKVDFGEMVYVGDNPEKDFYIGSVYPIKTVRINRKGVHQNKSYFGQIKEKFLMHNLMEISSIILH